MIKTYASGSPIPCSFNSKPGVRNYVENTIVQKFDAEFKISNDQIISANDKITIQSISGSLITPIQYQIVSLQVGEGIYIVGADKVEV
jgi:hypothetical protein